VVDGRRRRSDINASNISENGSVKKCHTVSLAYNVRVT
jgi:hypothetical protein